MSEQDLNLDAIQQQRADDLAKKVLHVFGRLAIDKRRLAASLLQKRGVPAYVGEWILDAIVPGEGPLSIQDAEKVQAWAARLIPAPGESNIIKNRLLDGEMVQVLTPINVEIELTRKHHDRVAKLSLLDIKDAFIPDGIVKEFPDLLK